MTLTAGRTDNEYLLTELETTLIAMLEFDLPAMREQLGDTNELVRSLRAICLDGLAVVDRLRDETA
jgi:hypothetical protein